MTSEPQAIAWANIAPNKRTAYQQSEVTRCRNLLSVRNADFAAHIQAGLEPPTD